MGTNPHPDSRIGLHPSRLASVLFSRTQQRVLGLLFGRPGRSHYLSEIIATARVGRSSVQREIARLVESGLVRRSTIGNQLHFQANPDSPIFEELKSIVRKTVGLIDPLADSLAGLRHRIQAAAVFGSAARGTETATSDVDLLIVSDSLALEEVLRALQPAEQAIGRRIHAVLYSSDEYLRKRASNVPFLERLMASDPVTMIGSLDAITPSRQTRRRPPAQD